MMSKLPYRLKHGPSVEPPSASGTAGDLKSFQAMRMVRAFRLVKLVRLVRGARMIARSSAARLEDVAYITAPATHSSSVATTRFLDPECSPEPHRPRAGPARARASSRRNASFGTSRGIASALRETRTIA